MRKEERGGENTTNDKQELPFMQPTIQQGFQNTLASTRLNVLYEIFHTKVGKILQSVLHPPEGQKEGTLRLVLWDCHVFVQSKAP